MQRQIEAFIEGKPHWKPNVLGQVGSWLKEGLRDRAITRDVPWGVPVPERAAALAGVDATGKVIYVWFDAPIGYISATREWAAELGKPELWKSYWQDPGTRLIHFIGKDNIVFHCIMFPAMLMAHGDYVLPADVPANEFLNIEGRKLSTSRGWAVWLHEYLEEFPPDLLRYALAATLPEAKDADFSWSDFQNRVNGELADILGNFVYRTMTFARRFADGVVPSLEAPSDVDRAVLDKLSHYPEWIGTAYESYRFREAVFETMALARLGNKYFNDTEPWHTRVSDPQACANTIHVSLQICAALGVLLDPVLPTTAEAIRRMVGLSGVRSSVPGGASGSVGWEEAGGALLAAGHELGEEEILFTKIEDETIEAQVARLGSADLESEESAAASESEAPFVPPKELIEYDDFARMDLRAGVILEAEPLEKSKKLVRLVVDLGFEKRQILAGVKEHFSAEELVGRHVVVVANLAPRKMMGLESQGMVLMAENRDGSLHPIASTGEEGAVVL
jgi:methionyl-tRNA synthetase